MRGESEQNQGGRPRVSSVLQLTMRSGLTVGLFFVLQGISFLLYRWGLLSSLLFMGAVVMVPISLVLTTTRYRDRYLGGYIRYIDAVGYMMWTYLFAIIIGTIAFYVSARILLSDPTFIASIEQSVELLAQVVQDEAYIEAIREGMGNITARTFTISTMTSALFFGLIFIYIAAIFIKRSYGK